MTSSCGKTIPRWIFLVASIGRCVSRGVISGAVNLEHVRLCVFWNYTTTRSLVCMRCLLFKVLGCSSLLQSDSFGGSFIVWLIGCSDNIFLN